MRTPAIAKAKLLPLIESVWRGCGYQAPLPVAFAWSCRGYYQDTMGKPGVNDRGINDDAIGFITENVDYRVQANVDPSVNRTGVASLVTGQVVWYVPGWHGYASIHGHPAFRQASPVIVKRDGTQGTRPGVRHRSYGISLGGGLWTDKDWGGSFWTNLHRQTGSGTSSLGCQTIPAVTWKAFHALVTAELKREGVGRFPCVILKGPIN